MESCNTTFQTPEGIDAAQTGGCTDGRATLNVPFFYGVSVVILKELMTFQTNSYYGCRLKPV